MAKNEAHNRLLQWDTSRNRNSFRRHKRAVKVAVNAAKEDWVANVAKLAEKAAKDGQTQWRNLGKLQMAHSRKNNWTQFDTRGPEEVKSRWYRYFTNILNVPSMHVQRRSHL